MKQKLTACDNRPTPPPHTHPNPPCEVYEQSHVSEEVDPPSLTDNQILIEERIDNYAVTNLPNEITEMILVSAVKPSKNSTETYHILLEI